MSDPSTPTRPRPPLTPEAALLKSEKDLRGLCADGCEGRCRICPAEWVRDAVTSLKELAALRQSLVAQTDERLKSDRAWVNENTLRLRAEAQRTEADQALAALRKFVERVAANPSGNNILD